MQWGSVLGGLAKAGDIICFFGDLGAGKTTFIKGVARGLRVRPEDVNSPTFVIMNMYRGRLPLYHFDFYRMDDASEIPLIGYEEFLYGRGLAVIEWADRMKGLLPPERLSVFLEHAGEDERQVRFEACGRRYARMIQELKNAR